jgi:hypothetical protein
MTRGLPESLQDVALEAALELWFAHHVSEKASSDQLFSHLIEIAIDIYSETPQGR